ncbi:response regulator (plasmid) [Kovacikia minuta CCNUW1]|uniref:response regulator n=1 Tax=Kovacikia minuta TaxID=2931930 RepID=UPI001CCFB7A0|nr:response regulator [Kovacikia minuta]UBF30430.1 response regulator [Kovacikia minuta CCNUW1]
MHQSLSPKSTFLLVDDHESVLHGTLDALRQAYPEAEIIVAQTFQDALQRAMQTRLDLVVVDVVIPELSGKIAQAHAGLQLLEILMERYPKLNIVVQSSHIRILVWLKPAIDDHKGGFTVVDKSQPIQEMLIMVNWALQQRTYTPREIRNGLQLRPEWFNVLRLAFEEGLQDGAIARRMNVSESSIQHYWAKIRDVLEVYPEDGKNLRVQTQLRAKEVGLIHS